MISSFKSFFFHEHKIVRKFIFFPHQHTRADISICTILFAASFLMYFPRRIDKASRNFLSNPWFLSQALKKPKVPSSRFRFVSNNKFFLLHVLASQHRISQTLTVGCAISPHWHTFVVFYLKQLWKQHININMSERTFKVTWPPFLFLRYFHRFPRLLFGKFRKSWMPIARLQLKIVSLFTEYFSQSRLIDFSREMSIAKVYRKFFLLIQEQVHAQQQKTNK